MKNLFGLEADVQMFFQKNTSPKQAVNIPLFHWLVWLGMSRFAMLSLSSIIMIMKITFWRQDTQKTLVPHQPSPQVAVAEGSVEGGRGEQIHASDTPNTTASAKESLVSKESTESTEVTTTMAEEDKSIAQTMMSSRTSEPTSDGNNTIIASVKTGDEKPSDLSTPSATKSEENELPETKTFGLNHNELMTAYFRNQWHTSISCNVFICEFWILCFFLFDMDMVWMYTRYTWVCFYLNQYDLGLQPD